jgi:acyl dehydratase
MPERVPVSEEVVAFLKKLPIGHVTTFSKTVSESDVYLYGGIVGDLARNHVDSQYMASTPYGRRVAHGNLILGYTAAASTRKLEEIGGDCVSYGYDRVRFVRPVYIGDTVNVTYRIERVVPEEGKSFSTVEVANQDGELCLVATHISRYFGAPKEPTPRRAQASEEGPAARAPKEQGEHAC